MANIKIGITENGTTTLATAGKYCDRNIDIEVEVPTSDGEVFNEVNMTGGTSQVAPFTYDTLNYWIDGKPFTINTNYLSQLFQYSKQLKDLSKVVINYNGTQPTYGIFGGCNNLEQLPTLNVLGNYKSTNYNGLFENCFRLNTIPSTLWDAIAELTRDTTSNIKGGRIFSACYSLREHPDLSKFWEGKYVENSSSCFYNQAFQHCYTLDEIIDIPVLVPSTGALNSSGAFSSMVTHCSRIKEFTFIPEQVANWSGLTLDLSSWVGYTQKYNSSSINNIIGYNSGITADKEVFDSVTYQALKDDEDWWTFDVNYSRYNHDSAVNTINSLPDTSAYGTNIIKFMGASGALTDGGAINTLTEEEIAVATAKGWTVSFV